MASVSETTVQKVQATATFSDGSTPADTFWSTDNAAVVRLDAIDALNVNVVALAVGSANVTVTGGGASDTAQVTVTAVAGGLTVAISFGTPSAQ